MPRTPSAPWAVPTDELVGTLEVSPTAGLSAEAAADRLTAHGRNELAEAPPPRPIVLFIDQFRNPLVLILAGAAVLAGLVGDVKDLIVIAVVLLLNALLGFAQEMKAQRSLTALKSMLVATARARRDGAVVELPAAELVPGDVVLVEAGDRAPADAILLEAVGVEVDESTLTGESTPVSKNADPVDAESPLADRTNALYMNTVVTRGRAEAIVVATGMDTELGRVSDMLDAAEVGPTPLQRQLHTLGQRLGLVALAAVAIYATLSLLRGETVTDTLLSSVALAVAAIPEGLPAVVTVTLAVGTSQMAKRGAIVKRLASVETLGATSVICSDKTGTLTMNEMTVRELWVGGRTYAVSGEGYSTEGTISRPGASDAEATAEVQDELVAIARCNDSHLDAEGRVLGDPMEGALLVLAAKGGVDPEPTREAAPRVAEVPFDSSLKLMATFHAADPDQWGDLVRVHVKGAADVLLDRSMIDADTRTQVEAAMVEMAGRGLRVLMVAERTIPASALEVSEPVDLLTDLDVVGLVGLLDPPRPEARDAIALCRKAGVTVKMITGDHVVTAGAIAADLGIRGEAVTGADLDRMDDEELRRRLDGIGVVARVSPEHKVRIVRALRDDGHVVAMTGDGVNDAPALRTADIGVAMGITGTEVTKEAADMVLTDDNFATIVKAVREGRTIYDNIVKFVRFQLSTNLGAIMSLVGAQLAGLPTPFTAIQVLWINLIMDGPPAMALGVDPPAHDTMERKPRNPKATILSGRRLSVLIAYGAVMAAGTLGVLAWSKSNSSEEHALALAFTTFVLFQVFNVFNARVERSSVFHRETFSNSKLWLAVGGVVALQIAAVHFDPVQDVFGTADLALADWAVAIGVASSILWFDELRKLVVRRRAAAAATAA
ncbi:MAG: HAD-IC family P-type ATPase [Acidimicrobiales bacterium]|nr:HAD-IC family P-type ATPase [Acidimicrobiales bacterium]